MRISLLTYKLFIENNMPYGKRILPKRPAVAFVKMTDGSVYHRINFIRKTLHPPIENVIIEFTEIILLAATSVLEKFVLVLTC